MPDLCFCLQSRWPELPKPFENLSKNEGSPPSENWELTPLPECWGLTRFPKFGDQALPEYWRLTTFPECWGFTPLPKIGGSSHFPHIGGSPLLSNVGAHLPFPKIAGSPTFPHVVGSNCVLCCRRFFDHREHPPTPSPPWRPLTRPFGPVWLQVAMALRRWPESQLS